MRPARRALRLSIVFVRYFLTFSSGSGCVWNMDTDSARSEVPPTAAGNGVENDGCPQIIVETTLALIKPDAVDRSEEIVDIILRSGFSVLRVSLHTLIVAIVLHLESNGLLNHSQHGFRKGGSCLSNLLEFLDYVTKNLDNCNSVDVIYLDFAKAFNKVSHCRPLEKINKHEISGKVWNWLR